MSHDAAVEAMEALLAELPYEFSHFDPTDLPPSGFRSEFRVIKKRNVRAVHMALWELQQHLGMQER